MPLRASYDTIKIERDEGITWVILNRPEKRNATNPPLHYEMVEIIEELETDAETEVLILTGAGESFSAGQDLREYFRALEDKPVERTRAKRASHEWTWERLYTFPKPTIAMVNGHCFGNAFTPLVACDFAIAADDATFGLSEINWGIYPGGMVAKVIADTVPYRDALLYMMTGRPFTGAEAAAMRLVTFSVPAERLREETVALARELQSKNAAALRATKEAYKAVRTMNFLQAHEYMAAKTIALQSLDSSKGRSKAMGQFLDEKSYRPGLEGYRKDS
jgi:trans-feruloyl-CoA hydratase/vanillin synthase